MNPDAILAADSIGALLKLQCSARYPLAPYSRVAAEIDVKQPTFYAWLADERLPDPATIRDVLGKLDASEAVVDRAMALWAAAKGAA